MFHVKYPLDFLNPTAIFLFSIHIITWRLQILEWTREQSQKMEKSLYENKYFKKKICMSVIETDLPVSLGVASMEGWILKVIDNLS